MSTERLLVRGVACFPSSVKVPFLEKVPKSLRCGLCENVSVDAKMDTMGHVFCEDCIKMMVNEDGKFECNADCPAAHVNTLQIRHDLWLKVLGLAVKCPKNDCSYQATLKDLMAHYPNCLSGGVVCPMCNMHIRASDLAVHTRDKCQERPLPCPFCEKDQKERVLQEHMQECDQRPGTCQHCSAEFNTHAEVRDHHYPVCAKKPIGCPYTCFGCRFQDTREKVNAHVREDQHIGLLVKRFDSIQRELKDAKDEINVLKQKNLDLEATLIEERQHRLNLEDNVSTGTNHIKELNETVCSVQKRVTEEIPRKYEELSQRLDLFATPMEELLKSLAAESQ